MAPQRSPSVETSGEAVLVCRGLVKRYGNVVAVDGLDLEVRRSECFGLLGPNGAGKTTTIEILEGLQQPDAGEVTVLGHTWGHRDEELRPRLGMQLQETRLSEKLTVFETLRLFRSFYPESASVDEVLALVELESKRDARCGTLSGGQKQRLAVACALVGRPNVLFLDEPTTGLDPQSRRQLWSVLEGFRARGGTILLTTHYMEEAATLCDRVAIVDKGRVIAQDTPRNLVASLGASQIVEFALEEGAGSPSADALRGLPGVQDVRSENGTRVLVTTGVHLTVPSLLAFLEGERAKLALLATHSATLEDVFVALTGRHLRDG